MRKTSEHKRLQYQIKNELEKIFYTSPVGTDTTGGASPMGSNSNRHSRPQEQIIHVFFRCVHDSPNRIERYGQYNTMDLDSNNAALDILAEFCSRKIQTTTQCSKCIPNREQLIRSAF